MSETSEKFLDLTMEMLEQENEVKRILAVKEYVKAEAEKKQNEVTNLECEYSQAIKKLGKLEEAKKEEAEKT